MDEPTYCTLFDICLSESIWISVWSGFGGALFAFIAAVGFEAWLRARHKSATIANLRCSLGRLRHYCDIYLACGELVAGGHHPSVDQLNGAWRSIITARSAIRFAIADHAILGTEIWPALDLLASHFDTQEGNILVALESISTSGGAPNHSSAYWFARQIDKELTTVLALLGHHAPTRSRRAG